MKWVDLEHQVWSEFKNFGLHEQPLFLIACSGGLDSMALLSVVKNLKPQAQIVVMHFHHGPGNNFEFRDKCYHFFDQARQQNQNLNIHFELEKSTVELKSEAEMRLHRLEFFNKIKKKYNSTCYLTAHHQDDVLETRLLKLMRGTGLSGLAAFSIWNKEIFRPFFNQTKKILNDYAIDKNIQYFEDPTNFENDYLRNWVRNQWITQLTQNAPGAEVALARSLQNIVDEFDLLNETRNDESLRYIKIEVQDHQTQMIIDRSWFASLSTKDQLRALARSIKNEFKTPFSQSQLKEVLKRLDKNQNDHIFKAAGLIWLTDRNTIVLKLPITEEDEI